MTTAATASRRKTTKPPEPKAPETGPDPAASTPVARLGGPAEDRHVEIDGKFYRLRGLRDYGIGSQRRLNRDGREFAQLWNSPDDLTEDQEKHLKYLLDRILLGDERTEPLVAAPKTVLRKLDDADRVELVLDFIFAPLRKMLVAAQEQTVEQAPNGSTTTT